MPHAIQYRSAPAEPCPPDPVSQPFQFRMAHPGLEVEPWESRSTAAGSAEPVEPPAAAVESVHRDCFEPSPIAAEFHQQYRTRCIGVWGSFEYPRPCTPCRDEDRSATHF